MGQPPRVVATAYAVEGKRQRVYETRVKRPLPAAAQPADDPLIFVPSTLLGELSHRSKRATVVLPSPGPSGRRAGSSGPAPAIQSRRQTFNYTVSGTMKLKSARYPCQGTPNHHTTPCVWKPLAVTGKISPLLRAEIASCWSLL